MRHDARDLKEVALDDRLSLAEAAEIAAGRCRVGLTAQARARTAAAHSRLQQVITEQRHVYGLTTGFGPLANRLVGAQDGTSLQQNLVYHLASGVGPPLPWAVARAMVLARLMSILQGASGASEPAITALVTVLNSDLAPLVPCRGTVGASGDLTPLAHMVLALQGQGGFLTAGGDHLPGPDALARLGLPPLDLGHRDGLALVNGTSAMTGQAVINARTAHRAIAWQERLTAALAEVLGARAEAWDPVFARLRPHPGQQDSTAALQAALAGSGCLVTEPLAARRLTPDDLVVEPVPGQDAYTLRCAPQVIGAVRDALAWHDRVVQTELQSVTDNPVFPADGPVPALHGGNFMGQHVALVSDALSNAMVVLAGLAERQIARLTDERLNGGLPAFLHKGPAGLNSGLMGAQVTSTALLAELRSAGPASVHSISTNGANQDVVSMGTIAARLAADKLGLLVQIQAILALAVAQAADCLTPSRRAALSPAARGLFHDVRRLSGTLAADRPLGPEITALADRMALSDPP